MPGCIVCLWCGVHLFLCRLGHPVAQAIQYLSAFIAGIVVGFISSWQLTLLIFASVPLSELGGMGLRCRNCYIRATPAVVVIMGFLRRFMSSLESRIAKAYAKAGDAANETFANIRTVLAYGGGENEVARYDAHLLAAMKSGEKSGWFLGAALGSFFGEFTLLFRAAVINCYRIATRIPPAPLPPPLSHYVHYVRLR